MARSMGVGDDAADALRKLIKKLMKNQAPAKVRYELQKNLPKIENRPMSSRIVNKPKKASDIKSQSWMGGKTTKGPKGKPQRAKSTSLKGREKAITDAEKREAERRANRLLRMNTEAKPKVVRDSKTGVSDSIPTLPKRSKSRPMGRSWEHEADELRRLAGRGRDEGRAMGRGQKPPKKGPKKPPPDKGTGGVKVKPAPKPKKPSGGAALVR